MTVPLKQIHQIELSSKCNLACIYCPHRVMKRKKEDMSWDVFKQAIKQVDVLHKMGNQKEVWLHGLGESLLHPDFLEMMIYARKELPNIELMISSNALLLDQKICREMARQQVKLHISVHKPEKIVNGLIYANQFKILDYFGCNPLQGANDWAGQVDWPRIAPFEVCGWIRDGWCVVLADGDIVLCCIIVEKEQGLIGNIFDNISTLEIKSVDLCNKCHLDAKER